MADLPSSGLHQSGAFLYYTVIAGLGFAAAQVAPGGWRPGVAFVLTAAFGLALRAAYRRSGWPARALSGGVVLLAAAGLLVTFLPPEDGAGLSNELLPTPSDSPAVQTSGPPSTPASPLPSVSGPAYLAELPFEGSNGEELDDHTVGLAILDGREFSRSFTGPICTDIYVTLPPRAFRQFQATVGWEVVGDDGFFRAQVEVHNDPEADSGDSGWRRVGLTIPSAEYAEVRAKLDGYARRLRLTEAGDARCADAVWGDPRVE